MQELFNVKAVGTYNYHSALNDEGATLLEIADAFKMSITSSLSCLSMYDCIAVVGRWWE
jgi:hypothetical protein